MKEHQKVEIVHQNISFAKSTLLQFVREIQPSSELDEFSSEHFLRKIQSLPSEIPTLLRNFKTFIRTFSPNFLTFAKCIPNPSQTSQFTSNPSQSLSQSIPPSFHFDRKIKLEMTQIPTFAQKISFEKFEGGHFSLQSISKECVYFLFEMRNGLEMQCEMKSKFETKCI